jgi:hypothetical protein
MMMETKMALNDGQDIDGLLNPGHFALSAEAAAAQLAAMKVEFDKGPQASAVPTPPAPVNAVEAHTKLEAFRNDPAKSAKFLAGDVHTVAEFQQLTAAVAAADPTDLAIAGILPDNHVDVESAMPLRDQISAANDLRESGLLDDEIRDVMNNRPISKLEHLLTQERWRERMGDKEWRQKLADRDFVTVREWKRLCANINKPIIGDQ